jgi:hypothetical protein
LQIIEEYLGLMHTEVEQDHMFGAGTNMELENQNSSYDIPVGM